MFQPMRIFQHRGGRFLCRADRGHKPVCWALFLVHLSQMDALLDCLTKIMVYHNRIYKSKFIYLCIQVLQGV